MQVSSAIWFLLSSMSLTACSADLVTVKIPKTGTQDADWYTYTGLQTFGYSVGNKTSFEFAVMACTGAQVALMTDTTDNYPLYEIVISGQDNSHTAIRSDKGGKARITSRGGMLDCAAAKAFRIEWNDGVISLIRKCRRGKWLTIMSWKDPNPKPVRFIGITTGYWASGVWTYNQTDDRQQDSGRIVEFETRRQTGPNYYYKHLSDYDYSVDGQASVAFSVKACSGVHVALMPDDTGVCALYEVVIGGYDNTLSVIRRGKNRYNFVTVPSSPANCTEFVPFVVSWDRGLVTVWHESKPDTWQRMMSWKDPTPLDVKYIGMTTGKATSGTWKVQLM